MALVLVLGVVSVFALPEAHQDEGASMDTLISFVVSDALAAAMEKNPDIEPALAQASQRPLMEMTDSRVAVSADADSAPSHRRLQMGTLITINYVVTCGPSCDDVTAALAAAAADPAVGLIHAQNVIDAIETSAGRFGYSGVVLSTAADIMATIRVPETVSIDVGCNSASEIYVSSVSAHFSHLFLLSYCSHKTC
jgi:hypothetical protein